MVVGASNYEHVQPPEPVFHRSKGPSFGPAPRVPRETQRLLESITRLNAELDRYILRADDYLQLVEDAWQSNFHASVALEGNPESRQTAADTIRDSLAGNLAAIPDRPTVQEFVNHLLPTLAPTAFRPPWSLTRIQELHAALLAGTQDAEAAGALRTTGDKTAVTARSDGRELFLTAPGTHVQEETEALLRWAADAAPAFHPAVAGPILFHEFESIHPFYEGNGRTGRVLLHLYLLHHGLHNIQLCLLEEQLLGNPDLYYRILAWADHTGEYTDLVQFMTERIHAAFVDAKKRLEAKDVLSRLDEVNMRLAVNAKRTQHWFSTAQAATWLAKPPSDQTLRKYLNGLVDQDILEKKGHTANRRYRFSNPLRRIRRAAEATLERFGPLALVSQTRTEIREVLAEELRRVDEDADDA